jgi:hypothetical protein
MEIIGQKLETRKIFIVFPYSRFLLNNKTSGRLDVFFWHTSYHPPMFFLSNMEEYIKSFQGQLETMNNMRLQLTISFLALA